MAEITMPSLADGMEQGTIVAWLVETGATVAIGDEIVEIETDKAAMAYAAEVEGHLEIVAEPGDTLPVGAVIARISSAATAASNGAPSGSRAEVGEPESSAAEAFPQTVAEAPAAVSSSTGTGTAVVATPLARRMAAAHGVALASITGTGPRGRITQHDVAAKAGLPAAARARGALAQRPPSEPAQAPAGATVDGAKGAITAQPLSRLQQVIARRMAEAKATIPHFQIQAEVRAGAFLALRAQLKQEATLDPIPSVNDLIVKAAALALRDFPLANGAFRDGQFELYERVNVGIAVAAQDALVVPVITSADQRSLAEIAVESRRVASRVRDGSVTPPELAGGTFTVSNLGMFGMSAIFPVINPGQAAILGVGASRPVPALQDGVLTETHLLTLTLSCDHRILYGAEAAKFLGRIVAILESPLRLLL